MIADGIPFTGFLYAGLMIDANGAPKVIEFNVRFGDPETQPVMLRLQSDLVDLVEAAIDERLDTVEAQWDPRPSLGVVMAASPYPETPITGEVIHGLDAVAATANKCLHGVPGASFVLVRRAALAQAASRTYYLDLGRLARLQDQRNTPFTPSVHAYYALVEALREVADEGGWRARHARYAALAEQARAGLAERGIGSVLAPAESSVVLRAYRLPNGVTYPQLHDALKARGFVIYAGQGGLSAELFRISTMGNIHAADIDRLLQGFTELTR